MLIAVNAANARDGGAVRHLAPFAAGLQREFGAELLLFVGERVEISVPSGVRLLRVSVPGGVVPTRLVWDQIVFRYRVRRPDLFVSPLNFGVFRPNAPQILFQRNSLYFDRAHGTRMGGRLRLEVSIARWYALASMRSSVATIVPTKAMREMMVDSGVDVSAVEVVPHPIDISSAMRCARDGRLPTRAKCWAEASWKLLWVSHPRLHKDVEMLPQVLRELKLRYGVSAELAMTLDPGDGIVGRHVVEAAHKAGVEAQIHLLGEIGQSEVFSLYRECDVLMFPSRTESFGFPILEAMIFGKPVVASDILSNVELGKDHAYYHRPGDIRSCADAVVSATAEGPLPAVRRRVHVAQFSWEAYLRRISSVIRCAAEIDR